MKYQELTTLPAFEKGIFTDGQAAPAILYPRWSGANDPPAIGTFVQVKINGIGPAQVVGYFTEHAWLGLLVKPVTPPEWFTNQNGYNATGHVFGAEVAPDTITTPVIVGPNQEQLEALQRYATSRGRSWKAKLNAAWMNGADAREPDGHLLRQVRNEHGPSWLAGRKNPIKPAPSRTF